MRSRAAVLFVLLVGVSLCGAAAFSSPAIASTTDIEIENTLAQSPSEDRIDVETRVSIPESTTDLEIVIPEETEVYGTDGFERVDDRTYEWTESTDTPTVRYEYQGTVRDSRGDRDGVRFVVTDEWALVRTPGIDVSWGTTDRDSGLVRENAVDGEGVASTHMAYLGPYTEHRGEAAGQQFRLVVPDAAELREDPADILATFEASAGRLTIGERGPEVFAIAAPTAEHTWVAAGVQRGSGGDMWVRDAERLGTNRDTWVHEYVHTRQRYAPTAETRWTLEGMADYYAALLPYEAGDIDYDAFVDRLESGADEEYDDVRLADPDTWAGTDADYDRGMLVFAHLDRKLRSEADTTLDTVIAEINTDDEELTQRRFLDAVEAAGGSEIRTDLERYTETTATPPIPTRSEHVEAFGGPDVRYSIDGTSVSGPYRNGTLTEPRLVTGETLEVNATARNVGPDPGTFEAEFRVDGETLAVESGHLESGETAVLAFSHEFDTPGDLDVSVGDETLTATVEEPAALAVTELVAEPTDPAVDEPVGLRATVESAADRPADGEVVFAVDGEVVASELVRLADGSTVVETTVSFDESGERTVSAGDRSVTVTVQGPEAVEETEGEPVVVEDQPGFGVAIALLALAGVGLFARRR